MRHKAARGAADNIAGSILRALLLFAGGLIFARLLGPGSMGEFALAASITGLAQLILEVGLGGALIQQASLREADIRFVFTATCMLGLVGAGASVLVAHVVTAKVGIPGALAPTLLLAGGLVLQGLSHTATSLKRRRLDFGSLQRAHIVGYLIGLLAAGAPLAIAGKGAVAPAAALAAQQVIVAAWALATTRHPMRPKFTCRRELTRFTFGAIGSNGSNWAISNVDTFAVAQSFGSTALGLYSRAYFLAFTPVSSVIAAFQAAVFAATSRIAHDRRAGGQAYLVALNVAATTMLPPLAALATIPELVLENLYGAAWVQAADPLRLLALGIPFLVLGSPATALLWSTGRALQDGLVTGAVAALLGVALFRFTPQSLSGVAASVGVAYAVRFFAQTVLCTHYLGVRPTAILRAVLPGCLLSVVLSATIAMAARVTPENLSSLVKLLLLLGTGGSAALILAVLRRNWLLLTDTRSLLTQLARRKSRHSS